MLYLQFPTWLRAEIIPGLPFRWYGLMYLVAFAIAYLMFMVQIRQRKLDIDSDTVLNFFFWGIIGLLVGARLFATLLFDPTHTYLRQPWLIFWPFRDGHFVGLQGMNYYGGLVGAIVAGIIFARVKKINWLDWGDMILAGVPLGYTFGRIGNFINAELYGRVTTAPWGFVFPTARRFSANEPWVQEWAEEVGMSIGSDQVLVNLPRHPTQLYEAFAEGILLWLILWFIFRPRKKYDGYIIGWYIILYGFFRFVIDYFRMPISASDFVLRLSSIENPVYMLETPLNLIPSQIYSFLMIAGGVLFLLLSKRASEKRAVIAQDPEKKLSGRKLRKKIR